MSPIRISMIGAGMIGQRHMEVLLPDPAYQVAGITDPAPEAEAFARQHGIPYFTEAEAMLDEVRPDGAIVASPNQFHVAGALACIARKLPVLVEKPLAESLPGALDIVAAAEGAGVPVLVGHHRRHNPIMRKAAQVIEDGGVGKVTAVANTWLTRKPEDYFDVAWRRQPGGGPVLINAIHEIDGLRMLCGEIESVQASTSNDRRGFPVEDTVAAVIRFESGALGTLIVSDTVSSPWSWEGTSAENPFYPQEAQNYCLVTGTKGALAIPSLDHWWHEEGQGWGDPLTRRRIPVQPADSYIEQMRNFAAVIRGEEEPVVSGVQGARTLAATLAITESAETGLPVRIDEMLGRR
ncbi:MAG: Gfo/Idh/MocA family oxidoreductase [Gemmatimonadales bacterium]